jgi:hypothetical protein
MPKNILILVLVISVFLLTRAVVRLENFHYASVVGMCSEFRAADPLQTEKRHECLHKVETRTNLAWHLYYALVGE